jgi:hypothetical protein
VILAILLIGARDKITSYLAEITPIGSSYPIILFAIFCISVIVFIGKLLAEYYQDTFGPQSTEGLIKYTKCKKGIQIHVAIHNYFIFKEWYCYLDKVYSSEEEAYKDLMEGMDIFDIDDTFLINRILRIRLIHQLEIENR